MKRKIKAAMMLLGICAMATVSQAVTVLTEDFESYFDGDTLGVAPGWTGDVTNQTAYVTNSGASLVGEFTGTDWGVIGMSVSGYSIPFGAESKLLSDYTIEFDVEKTEGTSTSPEVEVSVPGLGLVRMNYPDPTVGGGQTHVSLNLADNIYIDSGFTLYGQSTVDLVLKQFGGEAAVRQTYQVDNIMLSVEPSAYVRGAYAPTTVLIGDSATLSATYEDNAAAVETMDLYLDGGLVATTNSAGGSETNNISFDATGLAVGQHTVKVIVSDAGATTVVTNTWNFQLIADDPTILIGTQDFESYPTGTWNSVSAPNENPTLGSGATSAVVVASGSTNGLELQVSGNLSNQWSGGINFFMDVANNTSKSLDDYTVDVLIRFDDPFQDFANTGFEMIIWNPANGPEGSYYNLDVVDSALLSSMEASAGTGEYTTWTIPLNVVDARPYGKTLPLDASAPRWNFYFAVNNNLAQNDRPFTFSIDELKVSYTKPAFINPSYEPVGITTNDPVLKATVLDGTSEVDTMTLYLDGVEVATTNSAGGSTTNVISYEAIGLSGGVHTGTVVYADASLFSETNTWQFIVPLPPVPPATTAGALFNVNLAGCINNGLFVATNGTVLAAPTPGGSNLWNNAAGPDAPWSNPGVVSLIAANEDNYNTVSFETGGNNWNDGPQSWAGYFTEWSTFTNSIWGASNGDTADAGYAQYTGLNTNETYDVYVYFTYNRNDDAMTYDLVTGSANLPQLTLTPNRANIVANPTNYVEGENYVVFTEVVPDASGTIRIENGNYSAFQLVQRGAGGGGPTVDPDIMSMSMSGGMAHLQWDSELGVTYSVMQKANLTDPSWTVVTNVPGAGATTSASVPASSDQEFFSIEGN